MKKSLKVLGVIVPVSLILTLMVGLVLFFTPMGCPTINAGTNGFGIFDMRFSYTADNVMTVFSHYTGDLHNDWNTYYFIDFVFAVFCGIYMFTMPLYLYIKKDKWYLVYRTALFSAIAATCFNIMENILILRLMNITPLFSEGEADIASGMTSLKWVFIGLWAAATVIILIISLFGSKKRKSKKRKGRYTKH